MRALGSAGVVLAAFEAGSSKDTRLLDGSVYAYVRMRLKQYQKEKCVDLG